MLELSFGEDSVTPQSFDPIPEGVYTARCVECEVKTTKAGETMLGVKFEIDGPSSQGRTVFDNIVIPGAQRKADNKDTWNTMMNMLRDKLEGITGEDFREDNMQLDPNDLPGNRVKIALGIRSYDYTNTEGVRKQGTSNTVKKYLENQNGEQPADSGSAFASMEEPF